MSAGVRAASGAALPIDPRCLADLPAPERAAIYAAADLDSGQRRVAELAVQMVMAGTYPLALGGSR